MAEMKPKRDEAPNTMKLSAILLAAGSGSRFGGDKLLHRLAGGTPLGVAAARNLLAVIPDVVAVVREGDLTLASLLAQEGCDVRRFADAARGMGASLAHGVRARPASAGWLVALADMPAVPGSAISDVMRELESGAVLAAPFHKNRRGHPVGFGKRFGPQLMALDGDAGARDILAAHAAVIVRVACDDPGVLRDIDRRADL